MKKRIIIAILCAMNLFTNAQWVSQTSGTTDGLGSVSFVTNDTGYISSYSGRILKTTNGGAAWSQIAGPFLPDGINQIYFTSADTGFAINYSRIYKTINGGNIWTTAFTDSVNTQIYGINFPNKTTGYAIAQNPSYDTCFVYKTVDEGDTWTRIYTQPSSLISTFIYFINASIGYFYSDLGFMRSTDGGFTWNSISLAGGNDIDFPSSTIGYISADLGAVYKTIDGGVNWTPQITPTTSPLYSIDFTSIDTGYAVGGDGFSGIIIRTVDGGTNWATSLTSPNTFQSVRFPSSNTGYACGQSGVIYKYSLSSSMSDLENLSSISIYPNPTENNSIISFNIPERSNANIIIYDMIGKEVCSVFKGSLNAGEHQYSLTDNTKLAKGVYLVRLMIGDGSLSKKLIVK